MGARKASIKETGEELSQEDWKRFDRAVETEEKRRPRTEPYERDEVAREPDCPRDERAGRQV